MRLFVVSKLNRITLALGAVVLTMAGTTAAWANESNVIPNSTEQAIHRVSDGQLYQKPLTKEQQAIVDQAKLQKKDGWWHRR